MRPPSYHVQLLAGRVVSSKFAGGPLWEALTQFKVEKDIGNGQSTPMWNPEIALLKYFRARSREKCSLICTINARACEPHPDWIGAAAQINEQDSSRSGTDLHRLGLRVSRDDQSASFQVLG